MSDRRRVGRLAGAALVLTTVAATSCAPPLRGPRLAVEGVAPWVVPTPAFGTQRLFRGAYEGPEGEGGFRATLRLAAADRLQLVLADRLGRTVASLQVDGDRQRWVDHRRALYCTQPTAAASQGVALPGGADLPLRATEVPALLLGRLPGAPAAPVGDLAGSLDYRDAQGRRWTAELEGGRPVRWVLHDDGGPSWWWRQEGRGGVLSHREGRQLRWQEVVVEPLPALAALGAAPAGYREDCSGTGSDQPGGSERG